MWRNMVRCEMNFAKYEGYAGMRRNIVRNAMDCSVANDIIPLNPDPCRDHYVGATLVVARRVSVSVIVWVAIGVSFTVLNARKIMRCA